MKHIFFSFICLLGLQLSFAQDNLDIITDEACKCIQEKELTGKNQQELQMELGMCIIQSLSALDESGRDSLGIDMSDQNAMYQLGEKVGIRMAVKCPDALMKMVETVETVETKPRVEISNAENQAQGTITGVEIKDLVVVTLETIDGSLLKLVWLRPFDGAINFINDPGAMNGKQVIAEYQTTEIYAPERKGYVKRKEIVSLQVIE